MVCPRATTIFCTKQIPPAQAGRRRIFVIFDVGWLFPFVSFADIEQFRWILLLTSTSYPTELLHVSSSLLEA